MRAFLKQARFIPLLLLIFLLAVYHLDTYPPFWFDEGVHLQPPKNLVLYGEYALMDSGVLRRFDPLLSVGPPLLLPIAAAFHLLGIDLWPARFVTVGYLMLTTAVFYRLARQLYGGRTASLALGLLILSPGLEFVRLGRQVMGEIPALFYFLLGMSLWVQATRSRRMVLLVLAGLGLGLAMVTKTVYGLILPIGWFLLWLADRWRYRQLPSVRFLLPPLVGLACLAAWEGYQFASLQLTGFQRQTFELATAAGRSIIVFAPQRMSASVRFLLGPDFYLALGVPALAYNLYRILRGRQGLLGLQRLALLLVGLVWLIWYAFASLGWHRYALPGLVVTALFVARLLLDLGSHVTRSLRWRAGVVGGPALAAVVAMSAFFPSYRTSLYEETIAMINRNDDSARRFSEYLATHVDQDALIESWEWEITFFTDHAYHHPPLSVLDLAVRHVFLDEPFPRDVYDFTRYRPDYVVLGPFSKWTGLYPPDYLRQECTHIVSVGSYDLYRVNGRESVAHPEQTRD